ncbi:MAG: ABC transporter ATP-binding protein [Acidimicrobiales bacterium]|nr:ABC transporter ATP-binding protein [Acidimicrobiales bacterium]
MSRLLQVDGVSVRFGGIHALTDVGLHADEGEVVGLIGPNGAGKTTLFDVISGLRSPDTGRVHLDGHDVTGHGSVGLSRAGLRRTFQRVQLFGWLSVEDNVLTASEWRGGGGGLAADLFALPTRRRRERARRARVEEVLELCGIAELRHEPAGALPIGQARLVELARAIVEPPRLLLLDEPTSGLGEAEAGQLAGAVTAAREQRACAVVLVEHDIRFVMEHCQRIVVLELGRVLAEGTPEQIQADELVRAAYLGEKG